MKVIILAGSLGTRLSEETNANPKPMVEISGWVNGGFFVLSPIVMDRIEDDHTIWGGVLAVSGRRRVGLMGKIRVGQMGVGYWGPNLLRHFISMPEVEVVPVADLNASRFKQVGALYNGVHVWWT